MTERMIHQFAEPDEQGIELLRMAMEKLSLSARAYNRILKVARTIADLAGSEQIKPDHIAEAVGYRTLDRGDWQKEDIYNHKEDICKRIKIRFFLSFALKSWIYKGKKGEK